MPSPKLKITDPEKVEKTGFEAGLHISLLGGFQIHQAEDSLGPDCFRLRKARDLVKLLALAPRHRLQRDQLLEWLWPDRHPEASANSLHQTLRSARQVLEALQPPGYIRFEDEFLCLQSDPSLWVDVEAFEAAAAQAQQRQDPSLYQAALRLYSGELLPEDRYEDWAIKRREALQQTYLDLLLDLARLHEARGEHQPAITAYQLATATDPLLEDAHAGLMRLYALSGQRTQSLRQYQLLQDTLSKELGAEPDPHTKNLYQEIQTGRYPPQVIPTLISVREAPRHNLPALLSRFIGREQEIVQIQELLADNRLVTLTGSGGVGKTRLAFKVGEELIETFQNGVWLVELASQADPDLVPRTCAHALGILESPDATLQDSLAGFLENKHLLLILDNCEHVISACAHLANVLLKACPKLHILATSREITGLPGETTFRVPPLSFPDPGSLPPLDQLAHFESVRLFVERAATISPGFSLTSANTAAIAHICQRLDGIPLAIELAAARIRMLSPEQIAARLDDAFHLLDSGTRAELPHHQTLRASIDWSCNLLSEKERLLLFRLSVFAGGWALEAAEHVGSDEKIDDLSAFAEKSCQGVRLDAQDVMELLAQLVDKSLVTAERREGSTRYWLLETIRQYTHDRLQEMGCGEQMRSRHLAYFAQLTGEAEPHLRARGQVEWLDRLEEELDNLRLAMEWALTNHENATDIELGLKIAADLFWLWHIRGLNNEGLCWLKQLLQAEATGRADRQPEGNRGLQRARALRCLVYIWNIYYYLWEYTPDLKRDNPAYVIAESVALLRKLGPSARNELGISLYCSLGWIDPEQRTTATQEMLDIFHQENNVSYLAEYLFKLSNQAESRGDFNQEKAYLEKSLVISKEIEDLDGISGRLTHLGWVALFEGDYQSAASLVEQGLEISKTTRNRWMEAWSYTNLLQINLAQGNYTEAIQRGEQAVSIFPKGSSQLGSFVLVHLQKATWSQGDYEHSTRLGRDLIEVLHEFPGFARLYPRIWLGRVALSQDNLSQAEDQLKQTLSAIEAIFKSFEYVDLLNMIDFIQPFIVMFRKQGKMQPAARLLGATDDVFEKIRIGLSPRERSEHDEAVSAVRAELGDEAFTAAWEAGKAITPKQAIQELLASPG